MSDAGSPESGSADDEFPIQVFEDAPESDLRSGADDCYKCSACDTDCPVAAVDDDFPGPKFQGPEQWRLGRDGVEDVDPSIEACSNCMRCDAACPSGVPLSEMHNTARGEYLAEEVPTFSRKFLRAKVLANYRRLAAVASRTPRFANWISRLGLTKWVNERLLGITGERDLPAFAHESFREWWVARGGSQVDDPDGRVAYFHGCYANYNTPEVGKALVRVFEQFGYEVLVPEQDCSGTPMFANGMLDDARRAAETNTRELAAAIDDGADVVASCTSCSLSLRQEAPELFDIDRIDDVAAHTYEALEYLRVHEDLPAALADARKETGADWETEPAAPDEADRGPQAFAYHAPCHARNQGLDRQAVELFRHLDGVTVDDVGDSCSGISGTYGWKAERYETSMEIGAEMFEEMAAADGETGLTECPTCAMQMEHGTGYEVRHPIQVLEDALC